MSNTVDPLCPACESSDYHHLEFPEIYDGALICECQDCKTWWPRFEDGRLHDKAREIIASRELGL